MYTLWMLHDYLPDIVLCGGWVPFIYREYVVNSQPPPPLLTNDIDFAVPGILSLKREKRIDQILKDVGFKPVQIDAEFHMSHFGKSRPPVTKFEYEKDGLKIKLEFITALKGKGEVGVKTVQRGVTAEALRYVDILLDNYQKVEIREQLANKQNIHLKINIPTPAAYVYQKGLTFVRRLTELKKGKDLCYIYDLLENYGELHKIMYDDFQGVCKKYHAKWFKTFSGNIESYFNGANADGPILVQQQYKSDIPPEQFRQRVFRTFQDFLSKLKAIVK